MLPFKRLRTFRSFPHIKKFFCADMAASATSLSLPEGVQLYKAVAEDSCEGQPLKHFPDAANPGKLIVNPIHKLHLIYASYLQILRLRRSCPQFWLKYLRLLQSRMLSTPLSPLGTLSSGQMRWIQHNFCLVGYGGLLLRMALSSLHAVRHKAAAAAQTSGVHRRAA